MRNVRTGGFVVATVAVVAAAVPVPPLPPLPPWIIRGQRPVVPSISSRRMSACPACLPVSSIR